MKIRKSHIVALVVVVLAVVTAVLMNRFNDNADAGSQGDAETQSSP